jgi:hypothetical protein
LFQPEGRYFHNRNANGLRNEKPHNRLPELKIGGAKGSTYRLVSILPVSCATLAYGYENPAFQALLHS